MDNWELKPEEIKKKLDDMEWSFSRIKTADSCDFGWYLQYLSGLKKEELAPNAYAEFGTVVHNTCEKILKHEIDIFDAVDYYISKFNEIVVTPFPSNAHADLREKAYQSGLDYFSNLLFDFDRYEVLGVEKECHFKVGNYPFVGYIDALYRDKETGEIIIRDHKTTSFKYLKNGSLSKTSLPAFEGYKKQEYLYAIPVIEEYGKVDYLSWNMIRDRKEIKIPFVQEEFEETKEWAIANIQRIYDELLWLPDESNSYFCNVLCSVRSYCPYRKTE